jgi:hypothetical protein
MYVVGYFSIQKIFAILTARNLISDRVSRAGLRRKAPRQVLIHWESPLRTQGTQTDVGNNQLVDAFIYPTSGGAHA